MVYVIKTFISDYLKRTKNNIKYIEGLFEKEENINSFNNEQETGFNEITYKTNNLFGLTIFPHESFNTKSLKCYIDKLSDTEKAKVDIDVLIARFRKLFITLKKEKRFNYSYKDQPIGNIENTTNINNWGLCELFQVIRHIRNAFAHSGQKGITFYPMMDDEGTNKEIDSIIFYDEIKKDNYKFAIKLNIKNELDEMFDLIVDAFALLEYYSPKNTEELNKKRKRNTNDILDFLKEE